MFKDVFQSILGAAQKLFRNWSALFISLALYAALLAALYFSVTIGQSTWTEIVLGLGALPIAAIALFFTLQAMGLSYVRVGVGAMYLLKRACKECWLLLAVSLPLLLAGWGIAYLLRIGLQDAGGSLPWAAKLAPMANAFFFWFLLPLLAIHWWLAAAREGLVGAFKGIGRHTGRALAPRSVLIYLLVMAVFGALAYALFFLKLHVKSEWGDIWLFGARFAAGLAMIFLGWMITLGAMAEMTARRALEMLES